MQEDEPPHVPARDSALVRPYARTGGRTAARHDLRLETLLSTDEDRLYRANNDQAAMMRLCLQPRSVAEISALMKIPLGVTRVLLSDLMLHVPMLVIGVHQLTCVLLCLGLSSIAVGFGAMMPNFHETSPSKIAAGFGGTLNLVLSALYIMVVVVLTALPCHFYLLTGNGPFFAPFGNPEYR